MARKNQPAYKSTAGKKINTKWLNNVMKSIGSTTMDSFKTIAPNLYSAGEGVASSVRDIKNLTTGNSIGTGVTNLSKNKYINYGKRAFDNIIDDLKTGNLNNTERMNQAMDDSFGNMFDDFSFGDEEEGASVTFNYMGDSKQSSDATFELAKSIQKSGEANVKAQKATVDAMISVTSASMLQQQEIGKETNAHLGNINNNIAALVAYQQENTTKFYESAMAVFDRFLKKEEEESSGGDKATRLFNSNGGINPSAYKDYVKKQISSSLKDSNLGSMANMILSDDTAMEMVVSNPIGFASKMIIQGMVPHLVTNTIKGMEEAFTGFMPTMIAKLGEWRHNEEKGLAGTIKRLIGNVFGIEVDKLDKIDLSGKVTKDAAIFDGMTRNSIVEVIPKHLREMSSYLRDIAEHFKVDTRKSRQQAEIFDAGSGKYISIQELQKNIAEKVTNSVTDAMSSTEFGKSIASGGNELVGKDAKTYERMTNQMYEFMSRMDGAFTPESFNTKDKDSKINQILSQIDVNNKQEQKVLDVLTETINLLGKNQKGLHHSQFAAMRGIEAKNDTITSLGKDYDIENLIAAGITSETDINEFVDMYGGNKKAQQNREKERERKKLEEKAREKRDYKNRRKGSARSLAKHSLQEAGIIHRNDTKAGRERISADNADASTLPGFIANTGGHLKDSMFAAMNGDSKGAMGALGAIFTDGMKTLWGSIKENFLNPLKESIFGKKGEDGYIDGGLFSGVQNKAKDIWKEIGFHINGKEYTDSAGNKHEADPENSVIGRVKGIFGTITDSIKYRLFGDKDEEGKDDKKKGNVVGGIINTFKEGLLGWKHALFGDDPEKDADQQISDFKEKAMKAIPDLGVGAIGGLAMSQLSGGLLGAMIGGPFTGIALGMGTSLLAKSEKFQNYLFGPEVEDEDGNKSRVGGLISKKTQDMFKDPAFKKSAIGGAALGIAKSFIFGSSGGLLGSLVGGPIAGAIFGAGLGMLKKSEMFQNFMYGEIGEDGERSGGFKDKLKAKIKSTFGKENKEDGEDGKKMKKAFGMGALGAGAGGVMGLLMGGPIVGSVIGLASGIAASTGKFKKWFFGEKDKDGNVTKVGMLGKVGNWMHTEIMAPMKNKVLDIVEDFKTTIKYDVFNVAKILMGPAVDYVKESVDKVKEKFSQGLNYVKEKLFAPIGKLASTIMKPVKKAVGAVVNFAYKQVKTMVTLPFKVMKHVALAITSPFVKLAKGVKNIIKGIGKKIFNAIGFVTKKAFKLVAAPFNVAAGIANYLGGKAKDKLAGVGGDVKKKKHVKGEGWRVDLKNNKIDKENELRENKKNRRERANMAYNRSLVAKTLGYDVKYLTEANYEAALKVDKKLARKMKGPGFGRLGDKSKRQFEEDPAELARKQQAKLAKSSDADIASMDTKDQDIGTRNLIQSTRQTSILERIFNWLTGKKSKFGDSYGNVTDGGDAKDDQTDEGSKKPEDQNEEVEEENTEEDNRKWYEKISDEIFESGGVLNWSKGKLISAKDKVKGFFSKDSIKEGFENSDLNHAIQKVKGFFGSKNRTRAKGGPVEKGKSYLVGDGGTDPSAAEVFVPKTNGKILSQKNGGIKVTIEGIATKAIQAIKSIFTGGPGNILPGQSGGPSLVGNDDSSDSVSLARASVNANAEADYDEEGNLIKEKVDPETIDDIEDEDEKEDAIIAADNAADLANAKNAGSFISQRKKKEEAKNEENAKTQIDLLDKIRSGQEKANKEQKSHFNIWESVFSKKGLITAAILGLFAIFPNLPGTIVDGLFNSVKAIGKSLGLQIEGELEKNAANGGIGKNTDGNSATEEVQETINNVTDGNILDLQKDGSASKTSSSVFKVIGRAGLNWRNRYFTTGNSKTTKHIKKVMRGVETVVKTPGRILNRVINGKPTEYEKVIRDSKKNKLTYDKKNKRWIDNYNREVLSQDQWDELVKENGEDWAKANKDNYYLPDDKTSPKNPKQGKVSKKISEIKEGAKTKIKESKPGKKVTEIKEGAKIKIKESKPGQALEKGRTKIQNAQEAVKGKIDDAKGVVKGKVDDLKNAAKDKFKNAVSGKTDDLMKAGAEKADDAIEATTKKLANNSADSGWFKKVTGMVSDFFKTLFEKIAKASGKNVDDLVKVTSKFGFKNIKAALKKVWDKTAGKLIGFLTGKLGLASVSFGISELVGLGISAIDGATCAAKLFEVSKEDVDGTMTLISTAWGALAGTTVGGLFDLVCSVLEPFLGKIQKFICVSIYTFIKGSDSEDVKALGENQKKFRVEWEKDRDAKLKKEYETQQKAGIIGKDVTFEQFLAGVKDGTYKANSQSFEDYNTDVNGGMIDKTIDAVGGGITTAAHAVGTWWSGDTKYQDDKGNTYTKTKSGDWQVTDKDGKDIGTVNEKAIDTSKMKDVSTGGAWGTIKSGAKKLGGAVVDGAKKLGGAALDAGKNLAGKAIGGIKKVGSWVGGIFGFGGESEEKRKKEEMISNFIYKDQKTGQYWKYDKEKKLFYLYSKDGKKDESKTLKAEDILKMIKEKKLIPEKIDKTTEKKKTGIFGSLLNIGKQAINFGKNLIKKTPIEKAISFGKKMVGNITDKFTKEEVYRDPKDKAYWKYDAKKKVYYKYNVNNQITDDKPKTQKEIDKLFKDGKLVKDRIKKDNVLTKSIDAVKKMGKNAIDSAKKTFSTITDKMFKKPKNKIMKPINLHKKKESGKDYIYYAKKDKSYYACVGGKWYHFNKNGQKIDEKEISYSYIFSKFSNGDLVRDKISGKTKITNEKEMKKYIKSISKNAKKNDWETKKELDKKLKKQNKGKTKPKKRKTKKVFMSPDGDYYKKNKDGTYNHYNSIGNLIDENIGGEDKDKIEKKIKNGTLVSSEISEKKKIDASKVHGGINKTVNSVWKESQKNLEGNKNTVTGTVTGTSTKKTSSTTTTRAAKPGVFGLVGSIFSGIFGGGFSNEDDEIGGAGGDELNGFKFFSQKDKRWKDKDYSSGKSKSTMGKAGCGPTAMSMVASQLSGKNLSPVDIAADAKNAGFRDKTGTNANFISYESKKLNLPSVQTQNPSAEYISSQVDSGHPMILNGVAKDSKSSPYTKSGHYIVAVGKNDSGDILINDPRGRSKSIPISADRLASETRLGWSFGGFNRKKKSRKLFGTKTKGGFGENSFTAEDVIAVAKNEVGYSEKASAKNLDDKKKNAGKGNYTKYAKEVGHTNGLAWCATFVTWCFVTAANGDKNKAKEVLCGANTAGCANNVAAFKSAKRYDKKPHPGDVVFFMNGSSHTGLVIAVDGDNITTIEGNTSPGKFNRDGGCVAEKKYNIKKESRISGFGHPKYDGSSNFGGVTSDGSSKNSDATATSETNTDVSNGFLDKFQALASEYANRVMKGDYNSDFSSVLSGNSNSSDDSSNASGKTASAATEIEGKGNIEKVWNFFAKNGFSAAAISGIIGNMYQESGVNPKSIQGNGKGPAAGIFQWENYNTKSSRWKALDDKAKKEGKDWKDLGVQLDFALGEMKSKDIDNRLKGKYGIISNGKSKETTDFDGRKYTLNAIPDGFKGFKQIDDVEEAVKSFEAAYERAGKPNFKRRIDKAKEVYKKYGKEAPTTDKGGSGGFGDYDDEMDIFTSTYKPSSNTTTNTNSTSDDKLIKLLSGDHSEINRILNKSTSEEKMERLLEKMVSILESISDSSSSSITELKKIAANSKMNGQYNTNIVNGGGTNNIIQNGSGQTSSESRNSVLARQLAKG